VAVFAELFFDIGFLLSVVHGSRRASIDGLNRLEHSQSGAGLILEGHAEVLQTCNGLTCRTSKIDVGGTVFCVWKESRFAI